MNSTVIKRVGYRRRKIDEKKARTRKTIKFVEGENS